MAKFLSTAKSRMIAAVLVVAVAGLAVGGYFLFRKKGGNGNGLNYDYAKGATATKKVENAQYTPDMDKFIETNSPAQVASYDYKNIIDSYEASADEISDEGKSLTEQEFAELIDTYATIENYAGAGKYLGYDIYEIKAEIKYVVENVPAFDQWFRMPTMREKEGYVSTPYYENWAYYLELNEETNVLSITRVCSCTRSSYLDFDINKVIEDHADETSFVQYEIMKTNYLLTEEGEEVVECFIYSVGIDNVGRGNVYNDNAKDYYPFEYQYLKNVKDKYMIKYHITPAERAEISGFTNQDGEPDDGMDISGKYPYGHRREITIVNYDGYTNIEITKVDQMVHTYENSYYENITEFDMTSENIKLLLETAGLPYEAITESLSCIDLLDKISKQIVDNFELKNNWQSIYKESSEAYKIEEIKGVFYDKDMPISDVTVYTSCRGHYKDEIEFSAYANVYDITKLDLNKEYSLSMALKNIENGEIKIIATGYSKIQTQNYNESTDFYYSLKGASFDISSSKIKVDKDGTYEVCCVLTEKVGDADKIIFDPLETAYLRSYYGLIIPETTDENGVVHSYKVRGTGGKLTIIVSSNTENQQ